MNLVGQRTQRVLHSFDPFLLPFPDENVVVVVVMQGMLWLYVGGAIIHGWGIICVLINTFANTQCVLYAMGAHGWGIVCTPISTLANA